MTLRNMACAKGLAAAALAGILTLAGCGETDIISRVGHNAGYDRSFIINAIAGGFDTEVFGSPEADPVDPRAIADRLAMPANWPVTRFVAVQPSARIPDAGILRLYFNIAKIPATQAACDRPQEIPVGNAGEKGFTVYAVFCMPDKWLAVATLEARDVTTINDEHFTRAMTRMFNDMFPRSNRN